MQSEELKKSICEAVEDAKGFDTRVMDVRGVSDITDFMVVVSGTSRRHVVSVAQKLEEKMKELGHPALGVEGKDTGEWVLLDFGDVLVHVMRPEIRDFYNLEKLWGELGTGDRARNQD